MAQFRFVDRDTAYILPPSVDQCLLEDHLTRFVIEMVDELDMSVLEAAYASSGSGGYHPRMMGVLLFYSYATETFSSRKIETTSFESLPIQYVAANQPPDHDIICTFRKRFLDQLGQLFTQILIATTEIGLVEVGDVAIDRSKAKANARKHIVMSWEWACQLDDQLSQEVVELLEAAEQAYSEAAEGKSLPAGTCLPHRASGQDSGGQSDDCWAGRARYQQEKAAYEQTTVGWTGKEEHTGKKTPRRKPQSSELGPRDSDQINFTDPESRIMHTRSNSWQQVYNLQSSVDMNSYMIVGGYVSQATNDTRQLEPMVDQLEGLPEEFGTVERVAADAGYFSEHNTKSLTDREAAPYIPIGRQEHHMPWRQ